HPHGEAVGRTHPDRPITSLSRAAGEGRGGGAEPTMKLLLINPNITEAITAAMAEEARHFASPGTAILPVTAAFGTQYVENRVAAAIASHAVLDALARH